MISFLTDNCESFAGSNCMKPISYISWIYKRASLIPEGGSDSVEIPGIGQDILYLFLLGFAYQVILIFLEVGLIQRLLGLIFRTKADAFRTKTDDQDVEVEAERVHEIVNSGLQNYLYL